MISTMALGRWATSDLPPPRWSAVSCWDTSAPPPRSDALGPRDAYKGSDVLDCAVTTKGAVRLALPEWRYHTVEYVSFPSQYTLDDGARTCAERNQYNTDSSTWAADVPARSQSC
eukprot:gene9818-biopygen6774